MGLEQFREGAASQELVGMRHFIKEHVCIDVDDRIDT